jgi:hypothetical protein
MPYANATLADGAGLDDLRLAVTTMEPFVERFGIGRHSVTAGDEVGFEFGFPAEGLAFLFVAEATCGDLVRVSVRHLVESLREPATFFAQYPDCRSTPLRSIAVTAAAGPDDTWFKGATSGGVQLFTRLADVQKAYGAGEDVRGLLLASSGPEDARLDLLAYSTGLALYIGEATTGREQGHLVVRKMVVFTSR